MLTFPYEIPQSLTKRLKKIVGTGLKKINTNADKNGNERKTTSIIKVIIKIKEN